MESAPVVQSLLIILADGGCRSEHIGTISMRCTGSLRAVGVAVVLAAIYPHLSADIAPADKTQPSTAPNTAGRRALRISADPNNLPFTNDRGEGFENKIAELLAHEMNADLVYIWRAQRRGFFRHALKEGECDLVLGVPAGFEMALTTRPYYRSSYVFVTRKQAGTRGTRIESLDDPRLPSMRIGIPVLGDDGANAPPAHALGRRGIVTNLVGYSIYGDYRECNPPSKLIAAVARRDVDVAVAWGPTAGYFAKRSEVAMDVVPVQPQTDAGLPMAFSIAMGVRKGDTALRDELNAILERRQNEIEKILDEYGVPRVDVERGTP